MTSRETDDEFHKLLSFWEEQPPNELMGEDLLKWERQKLGVKEELANLSHQITLNLKDIGRKEIAIEEEKEFLNEDI